MGLTRKKNNFKLSGDSIFHTIQGEGNWAGKPCTFIRLHFCNLACSFCDTFYTWHPESEEYYTESSDIHIDQIKPAIIKAQQEKGLTKTIKHVVFTGGEPLIQQQLIVQWMQNNPEWIVQIETNGTIMPAKYLLKYAKFNCSPKLQNAHNTAKTIFPEILQAISRSTDPCFKFVCSSTSDIDEVLSQFSCLQRSDVWIMPEGVIFAENKQIIDVILDTVISSGINFTLRQQNILFDGAKRGV